MLTGLLTKRVPYTFTRYGYFYYSRRVPADLDQHYSCPRIVQALHTKSASTARTRSLVASGKLDEYWSHLRMTDPKLMGQHLLVQNSVISASTQTGSEAESISHTMALQTYLSLKGASKGKTFHAAARRACGYLVDTCGAKDLHEYTRADALKYRDHLLDKGLSGSSISRVLSSLTAVVNFAIAEHALDVRNPFKAIYHDRSAGVSKRLPIPIQNIRNIQLECMKVDDEMRWLVALLSDTGMRLAEAAGLLRSDLVLDAGIPFIRVQPHPWRTLKSSASTRRCL